MKGYLPTLFLAVVFVVILLAVPVLMAWDWIKQKATK